MFIFVKKKHYLKHNLIYFVSEHADFFSVIYFFGYVRREESSHTQNKKKLFEGEYNVQTSLWVFCLQLLIKYPNYKLKNYKHFLVYKNSKCQLLQVPS